MSVAIPSRNKVDPAENVTLQENTFRMVNSDTPYSVVPLGPKAQVLSCPHCHYYVTTEINIVPSVKTHFKAALLCFCCLCFIPYICPVCMNVDHFCPECENYIGTYMN